MGISENKKASNNRYMQKLDNIMIRPTKEEGAKIRAAAAKSPEGSMQGYVLNAVRARMAQDDKPTNE